MCPMTLRSVGFGGRFCTLGPTAKDPVGNGPVKKALGALGEKKAASLRPSDQVQVEFLRNSGRDHLKRQWRNDIR